MDGLVGRSSPRSVALPKPIAGIGHTRFLATGELMAFDVRNEICRGIGSFRTLVIPRGGRLVPSVPQTGGMEQGKKTVISVLREALH